MAISAPPIVTINPNYMEPGLILPYMQASGAFDVLPEGDPRIRLGEEDLVAYYKRVDMRAGRVAAGQQATGQLPSPSIVFSYFSAPTYLLQMAAEYNHHDVAAANRWGVSLDSAYRLAVQQAIAQVIRVALLYGMNPANGEGLAYATGATSVSLPADSNSNTRFSTYDNGQLAFFFTQLVQQLKSRTYQLGTGRTIVVVGPQQDLGLMEYNIVQLTQFQRVGAGTESTKGVITSIFKDNDDTLIWAYDDTLIGKGAGGTDLIIMAMPTVSKRSVNATLNTNKFAELQPGIEATLDQLTDMAAPREITSPMARGFTDKLYEQRITSGIVIRPEAITLLSGAN